MDSYPETVAEVLDASIQFPQAVVDVVQRFSDSRPWTGTLEERKEKFLALNSSLAEACGIRQPELHFEDLDGGSSGRSSYAPSLHRIVIVGKLSVVTFLHEFAHAQGMDERGACSWSINLFRRVFPRQYGRLVHCGHMLVSPRDAPLNRGSGEGSAKRPDGLSRALPVREQIMPGADSLSFFAEIERDS